MSEARTFDPAGVAFGVLVPVAAAVTVLVTAQAWKSRLPSEIATHFSGGTVDGFTATSSASWTFVLVIVLVGGGCSAVAALGQALLMMRRTMLIVGSAVTGLMLALWLALMSANLDIADPADVVDRSASAARSGCSGRRCCVTTETADPRPSVPTPACLADPSTSRSSRPSGSAPAPPRS